VLEIEKFLQAIKDELNLEVNSIVLFPFDQANLADARLG